MILKRARRPPGLRKASVRGIADSIVVVVFVFIAVPTTVSVVVRGSFAGPTFRFSHTVRAEIKVIVHAVSVSVDHNLTQDESNAPFVGCRVDRTNTRCREHKNRGKPLFRPVDVERAGVIEHDLLDV